MRSLCVMAVAVFCVAGCQCAPDAPKAVTLRLKNDSRSPVWIDNSANDLGLQIQRNVGGTWYSFVEAPRCACEACDQACSSSSCDCPEAEKQVRRIDANTSAERSWSGVVQLTGSPPCALGQGATCLSPENAPYNETFNIHLCYALQVPGVFANPDGGSSPGALPADATCVDKEFRIDDGVVEVGPARGADCITTADCKGKDELCFSGSCTSSCPDNDYPVLGANWALRIASPDDQGFFTTTMEGNAQVFTGTGTIASATYQGSTVTIRVSRKGSSNETLNGALYVTAPPSQLGPLTSGTAVSIRLVDASSDGNPENRALVIRDGAGVLLFAADVSQEGQLLTNSDTAPFAVSFETAVVGCRLTGCGRQLFTATRFTGPTQSVLLEPGKTANTVTTDGTYRLLDVSSSTFSGTNCSLSAQRPWLVWRDKAPGAP